MSYYENLVKEISEKLSKGARDELRQITATPEAKAIFEREDVARQARRADVMKTLAAVPAKFAKAQQRASAARAAAEKRIQAAQAELVLARDDMMRANGDVIAARTGESIERETALKELLETSDSRLQQLVAHCDDIAGAVRNMAWASPYVAGKDELGRDRIAFFTNQAELLVAQAGLQRARDEAMTLMLKPLRRAEVTERLRATLLYLTAALSPVGAEVLKLDEVDNLVRDRDRSNSQIIDQALAQGNATSKTSR